MKLNRDFSKAWFLGSLIFVLAMLAPKARANVFATNLRIDGGTTNIAVDPGTNISISFRLNEPASLGTTVQIRSGASVVTSLFFARDSQGALRGLNEVAWDGLGPTGQPLPGGTYSVAVIPASSGYTNWTQLTSDTADPNTYVFDGRGLTVDRNSASPYFGRVFIANSSALGPNPSTTPGDTLGILKFNADTSGAEEGISSADLDGYTWLGGDVSPSKLEVASDDNVYVIDLARGGLVNRWDPTISSNSLTPVLRQDNLPPVAALGGPAFTGGATNMQLWMVDTNMARVLKWSLTTNSVCLTNDKGITVVSNTGPNFFDVALDKNGNIYTCAFITAPGDPSPRVFRYPSSNPVLNGLPQTNADWAVGNGDDTYAGASGIAVDPTSTYLAVAFEGPDGGFSPNGNTKILYATNGALAANLDLGLRIQNDPNHDDTDVAWDAVGNVYYIDYYWAVWRSFSPPGTNQSTTIAPALIQLSGSPTITKVTVSGSNIVLTFSGNASDAATAYTVLSSPTVTGTYANANAAITVQSPGVFQASVPISGPTRFYRIRR